MRDRLLFLAVCTVVVVVWSSSDAGAQSCPEDAPAPQATSEHVEFTGVVPGQTRSWPTTVTNAHDRPVEVRATLEGTGTLSSVLRVGLRVCDAPWQTIGSGPATCPTGAQVVLAPSALGHDLSVDLPDLAPDESWHALFSALLPASTGNEYQGATGSVRSLVVWQEQCGSSPSTTTPGPAPTAVPVTVPPTVPPDGSRCPSDDGGTRGTTDAGTPCAPSRPAARRGTPPQW